MRKKLTESDHGKKYKGEDVAELLRFLKARDNDLEKTWTMYSTHLEWRDSYKPSEIDPESIKDEIISRKLRLLPTDNEGSVTIAFCAGKHFPGVRPLEDTIKYLVWTAEKAVKLLPPGKEKFNIIYDRRGFTRKNFDRTLISSLAHLLEANYPERVHLILIYRSDWLFNLLYAIVKPFLPAATVKKIRMLDTSKLNEEMLKYYEEDNLWHRYGGKWHDEEANTSEGEGEKMSEEEEKEEKKSSEEEKKEEKKKDKKKDKKEEKKEKKSGSEEEEFQSAEEGND